MSEAYSNLAQFYDDSMEVDYQEWVSYLLALMLRHGHVPERVLDLGCGTANLTIPLAKRGYDLTGVDLSSEMIAQAKAKSKAEGLGIDFFAQDLRELRLGFEQFDTVISGCDVLNYLIEPEDLGLAFLNVQQVLKPRGLWLFDLNSASKLQEVYGNESYADLKKTYAYFWDNSYDYDRDLCQMQLTFFIQTPSGLYERKTEVHKQKLWWPQTIRALAKHKGFTCLACYNFLSTQPCDLKTERWQFVLRK